tara:strand:+ start:1676 stop:1879 length:204 start_codon:yes stop_codon:yes gene_type:complete
MENLQIIVIIIVVVYMLKPTEMTNLFNSVFTGATGLLSIGNTGIDKAADFTTGMDVLIDNPDDFFKF